MDKGWTLITSKKNAPQKKAPQKKQKPKKREESTKSNAGEEPIPVLNDVFDMKPSSIGSTSSDMDPVEDQKQQYEVAEEYVSVWKEVSDKKSRKKNRRKKEKAEEGKQKAEEKEKKKKKVQPKKVEKSQAEISKAKDEKRARKEFKTGDSLLYHSKFINQDVKANIIGTTADSLTITWDGHQKDVGRYDRSIQPIWHPKSECYFPLPKKEKKKKAVVETERRKKEKKKKPKKKGPKKLTSATAILNQISAIIQSYGNGDKMGLPEIMNYLRDHLQGGSWNQKKYKGKFGTMKKFLQKHKDRFIVADNNNNVEITRLPPPPPKLKKDSSRGSTKPATPRGNGENTSYAFMFILVLVLIVPCIFFMFDGVDETLKKIQGRLHELFFSPTSSNQEL